jgi:pimeloyl-ACP methyl ester carboxylesterase
VTAVADRPLLTASPLTRRGGRLRRRVGRLERPLLLAGLALVTAHLLDLAVSGPDTTVLAVAAIVAVPVAWALSQPHVTRPTRLVLAVAIGLLTFGFGVVSHGLHVVNSGPDWTDVTGVGAIVGGLLLVASGLASVAAPGRPPRRPGIGWRAAHVVGWLAAVPIVAMLAVLPFALALLNTHAPRWKIQESSLGIPHEEVRIATADGRRLSAWYVPSRNRAAVVLSHGSGGSRERVAAHIRMLARNGYGVLALDNPGNGESEGHSNGLGDNAQPGMDAAIAWVSRRPDVDPRLIAGFGTSLGAEVLLETAAREPRLRAVVADGSARPEDSLEAADASATERTVAWLGLHIGRGISGMRPAPSLYGIMPRIAPRPVLLIAGGAVEEEVLTNRRYRDAGGATTKLWTVPGAGHTAGLRSRAAEYERRTIGFLDRALGVGRDGGETT